MLALPSPPWRSARAPQPADAAAAGATWSSSVRVPNEEDDAATTKVELQLPPGFAFASYQPVPGWSVKVAKEKLATPVKTDDGEITEQVRQITWTADAQGGIAPGQFQDFPLSVQVPGKAGDTSRSRRCRPTRRRGRALDRRAGSRQARTDGRRHRRQRGGTAPPQTRSPRIPRAPARASGSRRWFSAGSGCWPGARRWCARAGPAEEGDAREGCGFRHPSQCNELAQIVLPRPVNGWVWRRRYSRGASGGRFGIRPRQKVVPVLAGLAIVALTAAASVAQGAIEKPICLLGSSVNCPERIEVDVAAQLAPQQLPKKTMVPVATRFRVAIASTDGSVPSP